MEEDIFIHHRFSVHAVDAEVPHFGHGRGSVVQSVTARIQEGQGVTPERRQGDIPRVQRQGFSHFRVGENGSHFHARVIRQSPPELFGSRIRSHLDFEVVRGFFAGVDRPLSGVVSLHVVLGNDVKNEGCVGINDRVNQLDGRVLVGAKLTFPIGTSDDFGLVERKKLGHLNGACREGIQTVVHHANGQRGWVFAAGDVVAHIVHKQGVIGKGGWQAIRRKQHVHVGVHCRLARLSQDLVGTNRVNRRVVVALVRGERCSSVVNDGVGGAGDPISSGGSSGSFQISLCRAVVSFDEEHPDFVGAVGSVRLVQFLQNPAVVVVPARSAPRCRKVNNHLVSRIQQAVQVVLDAVNARQCPIRSNASIGELSLSRVRGDNQGESGKELFHERRMEGLRESILRLQDTSLLKVRTKKIRAAPGPRGFQFV